MYQAIIFGVCALLCTLILLLFKGKEKRKFDILLRCLTVLFCAVGFFRFFLSDAFVYVINGAAINGVYYDDIDVWQTIMRWGYYTSYSVLPMAVFFDSRFFRNVASYLCLPFAILSTVFFNDFMEYFLSTDGNGIHMLPALRYAYFILELVLAIMIPLLLQIKYKHYLNVKDGEEIKNLLFGILPLLAVTIPVYLPQSLLGYGFKIPGTFSSYHLTWIGVLFAVTLALYYVFRFRSRHDRYLLCMFLVLVLFFHYNSLYLMGVTIKRLPFQLCNIAAYFYLVAMLFKLEKMFQFCFIANIVGTLIAILAPDFAVGDFSFWNTHYILEHSLVLIIPAMVMGLRIFPRISLKSLKYYFIGFSCYFAFAFLAGTILNGYSDITGERVNYFFMFDLEMAFDYAPFLTFTENYHYTFGRFEVYPLIVMIIYVAFSILCCLFYLLIKFCYKMEDDHLELRRSGIDLYEKITKKTSRRPKQFIE